MKVIVSRLWSEQDGAIVSAEIMLVASILVISMVVGLTSLRDSVTTELADVAQALANVDQTYSYNGTSGHHSFTGGGFFFDVPDFCDNNGPLTDAGNSKCVLICGAAVNPGGAGADGLANTGS